MPKRLDGLKIGEVSGVDHPAHLEEGWMVMKAVSTDLEPEVAQVLAAASFAKAGRKLSADRLSRLRLASEQLAGLIAEVSDQEEPVADLHKSEGGDTPVTPTTSTTPPAPAEDEMLKSLPEPLRKRFSDLEDEVAKARDDKANGEALAKARSWSHIPEVTDEFAATIRKAREGDTEAVAALEKALDAANTALANGPVFKEFGSATIPTTGDTGSKLTVMAKAKSEADKISEAEAMDAILATPEGKALWDQYDAERRQGVR